MKCPFCGSSENGVVDSRETDEGRAIRRRRNCASCARRFTTYERVEEQPLVVIKKDGSRVPFDRNKLIGGMTHACQKRPVPAAIIDRLAAEIEKRALEIGEREISSRWFGEQVMRALRDVDEVAYVRFASVYRSFKDVGEFGRIAAELHPGLLRSQGAESRRENEALRAGDPSAPPEREPGTAPEA